MKIYLTMALWLAMCLPVFSATWYVRTDGGTSTQCTGQTNAAYPGSGIGQACAVNHPFWLLPPGRPAVIAGGDTVLLDGNQYMMGHGAPNATDGVDPACNSAWAYACIPASIPAGIDTNNPTRILGAGWDTGCAGTKTQLWGTQRIGNVLGLGGSNIDLQCLDITDHSACIENGPLDGNVGDYPSKCERTTYPFGTWGSTGIASVAGTSGINLENVDIHGMASRGIMGYRNGDWNLTNVNIIANGFVGWDSDGTGDDSYTGTTTFDHVKIEWSGCGEKYPLTTSDWSSSTDKHHCWSQSQGGFGDGIGLGDGSMGNWTFLDSSISFNTSDGVDLLHGSSGTIKFIRSKAEGNAGNAFKSSAVTGYVENSLIIGNCGFHYGQPFTSTKNTSGGSVGFDTCRANGDTVVMANGVNGQQLHILNSTILSNGDSLIISSGSNCNGATQLTVANSILRGGRQFNDDTSINGAGGNDTSDLYYAAGSDGNGSGACGSLALTEDYNIIYGTKGGAGNVSGAHSVYADPGFMGTLKQGPYTSPGYYTTPDYADQLYISASNGSADESVTLQMGSNDYNNFARGAAWDIGALEYGSIPSEAPTDTVAPITTANKSGRTESRSLVELSCTDDVSCTSTLYCQATTKGGSCTPNLTYSAPFKAGQNRAWYSYCYASGDGTNTETAKCSHGVYQRRR